METARTLAVDIGGTGIKVALLDENGGMIGERVRVPTPPKPVAPAVLTAALDEAVAAVGSFDRASVGFPGAVRDGRVLTAPNLGTEVWSGFDLQTALSERWGKPVRVMNDADVQGFGAIQGEGVEFVLTLGTGAGTSIFYNGRIMPHLELAHHPVRGDKTYDEYLGRVALEAVGKKKWNKRVERVIEILRRLTNFDHLYIGGGNAKAIKFELPPDVTIVPNSDGLTGGIALWRGEQPAPSTGNGSTAPAAAKSGSATMTATEALLVRKAKTAAASKAPKNVGPVTMASGRRSGRGGAAAR